MYVAAAHEHGPSSGVLHWAGRCQPSCKTKSLIQPCWRHQRGIVSCVWLCCFCFAFCANALLDHLMSNKKILGNTTMSITSSDSVHLCNSEMALKSGVVHWHGAGVMWHTTPMSAPAPLHCLGAITLLLKVPQNTRRWPGSDGALRGYIQFLAMPVPLEHQEPVAVTGRIDAAILTRRAEMWSQIDTVQYLPDLTAGCSAQKPRRLAGDPGRDAPALPG